MKKIFFAMTLLLSFTMMSAQPKNPAEAQKAIDKAVEATKDAKKAVKAATWIGLANAYINAYELPTKNLINASRMEVKLLLKDQQVLSTETFEGASGVYDVDVYADKKLYYNQSNGMLEFWEVTKPAVDGDLLAKAEEALSKAAEVEPASKKIAEVKAKLEDIHSKYYNEAILKYSTKDFAAASKYFAKSIAVYENPILAKIDTNACYNTALVASMAGDNETAIKYYQKCVEIGHTQDGSVYGSLADAYKKIGDEEKSQEILESAFAKFPTNQNILIGLINLYREKKGDTQKLFDLIHKAEENEPNNASLFNVEGDIYKELGQVEDAVASYTKAGEVNPEFFAATYNIGDLYYKCAVEVQDKANVEFDDAKYNALIEERDSFIMKAIAPFESVFEKAGNAPEFKRAAAEYLKTIYFIFREKSEEYKAAYEKYNSFLENN